jgi:hypothetical protein
MSRLADHITRFKAAIQHENDTYRRNPCIDSAADAATAAVGRCIAAIEAITPEPAERMIYAQAMAAALRWWAIAEGTYSATDIESIATVRLIDLTLTGTDYDALPWLWHERGKLLTSRPAPVVSAAA